MRIRKLELNGFKSFPDRTTVQFGAGISGVIGPNGCGKSNILDAIKWVIGEQSAKALRGSEMLDVIFAGSADRSPNGYAEVSLTLSAEGGEPFPGEFARLTELQVGRRLHRSGASEYFLNQSRCRRRDIVDLFLDTGVGSDLYCFIEQGSVGKVVHATPEERRVLIEEAAGISRYRARRAEARSRLEATTSQLDRAADVADEMGRRLRALERQVHKAARWRRLRALVRQKEIVLALARYADLAATRRAHRQSLGEATRQAQVRGRLLARKQADLQARREELEVVEAAASTWRDEVAEQDARWRELEGTVAFEERRDAELAEEEGRLAAELAALEAGLARLAAERDDALRESDALAARLEVEEAEVASRDEAVSAAVAHLGEARAALEAVEREAAGVALEEEGLRARLAEVEARRAALPEEARIREARAAEAHSRATEARTTLEAAASRLPAIAAEHGERAAELEALREEVRGARGEVKAAEAALGRSAGGADARGALDAALAEARQRSAAWTEAAARRSKALLAALEAERARELEALEAALDARVEAAVRRAGEAVQGTERAATARLERELAEATAGRDAADEALERGRRAREEAEAEVARLSAARQASEARLAALRARELAERGALPVGLRERARRVDLLDDEDLALALGDAALLPVVSTPEEILALAPGLGERVRLFWPARPPSLVLVDDLASALDHHARSGGAAAVRGTGERVDGDGTVHLGPAGDGRDALRRRQAVATLEEELARTGAAAVQAGRRLDEAREVEARVRHEADACASALREAERRGREAVREAVAHASAEAAVAVGAVRDGAERERSAARSTWEERVQALRARVHAEDADLRAQGEAALERLRVEGEARLRELRQEALARDEAALDAARARLGAAEEAESRAGRALQHLEIERVRVEAEQRAAADRLALASEGERAAAADQQAADEEALALGRARRELRARLERLQGDAPARREEALAARAALVAAEEAERAARDAGAQLGVRRATLAERLQARRDAAVGAAARCDEAVDRATRLKARRAEVADLRRTGASRVAEARAELTRVQAGRDDARERLERERERLSALREGHRDLEGALAQLAAERDEAAREADRLELEVRQVQVEVDALRARMDERHLVSLPGLLDRLEAQGRLELESDPLVAQDVEVGGRVVEGVPSLVVAPALLQDFERVEGLVAEVEDLRRELAGLGDVNPAALEEYEDVRRRHDDLAAQRADLEASVADVRSAIARMNRTCRQRFRDTFDLVAGHFAELYPRLMGGGSARLALTDEEDLLETGVDIWVQPPGKRLQNLSLLSGGEKAMTAIAMILALFRVKPSPFCVLDEVDAPLDEANGGRFNELLREMAHVAQFILITHNRKTMEAADTLYGVTMATPGVSRLVSVRVG